MEALIRKFWRNPKTESKNFAPKAWALLCCSKKDGELGFRYLLEFNLALLAKFVWWILTNKDCLCVQVLRANIKLGEIRFGKIHQKTARELGKALKQQTKIIVGNCL